MQTQKVGKMQKFVMLQQTRDSAVRYSQNNITVSTVRHS